MSMGNDNITPNKCYKHFKTDDCNTANCAAKKTFNSGEIVSSETTAKLGGSVRQFKYTAVPLTNESGDIVAAFEMFMDETDIKSEAQKNEKISDYQTRETEKLIEALQRMAEGDLDFNLKATPGDTVTAGAQVMFEKICNAVNQTVASVKHLVTDANELGQAAVAGRLDLRADASKHKGEYSNIIQGFNSTLDSIVKPLNVAAEYVERIAMGDIPNKITDDYKGDFNSIKNNLNTCIDSVNELVTDANMLAASAIQGKLQVRADVSKHRGEFKKIIEGVNGTLDAVVEPINITANTIEKITNGELNSKINVEFKGDFNPVKNNLNSLIDNLNVFIAEVSSMHKQHTEGSIDYKLDEAKVRGAYREMYHVVNDVVLYHIGSILDILGITQAYAQGDLTKISKRYPGKQAIAHETMDKIRTSMLDLTTEFSKLIKATHDGDLQVRGNADKFRGVYKELVVGLNSALDNVIAPIKLSVQYIESISNGIIPAKITEEYSGEYQSIKVNLNKLIDNLNGMFAQTDKLINAIMLGNLQERGDEQAFMGAWKTLVGNLNNIVIGVETPVRELVNILNRVSINDYTKSVTNQYSGIWNELKVSTNDTIARLQRLLGIVIAISKGDLSDLPGLKGVGRRCENDQLVPSFIILMESIQRLSADVTELTNSAVAGKLSARANASVHSGEYHKIVQGFNDTLDAVIAPIEEAGEALEIMSTGDLTATMNGDYKGDHKKLKDSINYLGSSLSELVFKILNGVESSAGASVQISATSDDIATASQEQSARTEDLASAIEEMSQTITENASNAQKTAEMAKRNGKVANDGGLIVEQTVSKMKDIANVVKESAKNIEQLGESSRQIGEIISVIDDIADQTNLLALNAAIEAARAGEQGRGFAVVADEVRKLAERTTDATKKIAGMIKNIQKETNVAVQVMQNGNSEVSDGIVLADKAGEALKEIVVSSQQVLDMISHIASANEQQATTSEEISHNITSISSTATEAARRIHEIAQASEDLSKLTDDLRLLVERFKTNETKTSLPDARKSVLHQPHKRFLA